MNSKIWDLYKNSEEGKNVISLFDFANDISMYDRMEKLYTLGKKWGANSDFKDVFHDWIFGAEDLERQKLLNDTLNIQEFIDNFVFVEGKYDPDENKFIFEPDKVWLKKENYREKVFHI